MSATTLVAGLEQTGLLLPHGKEPRLQSAGPLSSLAISNKFGLVASLTPTADGGSSRLKMDGQNSHLSSIIHRSTTTAAAAAASPAHSQPPTHDSPRQAPC